jgi:hypothetical protein
MAKSKDDPTKKAKSARKTRLSQSKVPAHTLDEALKIPRAIVENFASQDFRLKVKSKAMLS